MLCVHIVQSFNLCLSLQNRQNPNASLTRVSSHMSSSQHYLWSCYSLTVSFCCHPWWGLLKRSKGIQAQLHSIFWKPPANEWNNGALGHLGNTLPSMVLMEAEVVELLESSEGGSLASGISYYSRKGAYHSTTFYISIFESTRPNPFPSKNIFWRWNRGLTTPWCFPDEEELKTDASVFGKHNKWSPIRRCVTACKQIQTTKKIRNNNRLLDIAMKNLDRSDLDKAKHQVKYTFNHHWWHLLELR